MAQFKGSVTCIVCGGSYATDQRRKHEATQKHHRAVGKPPVPSPEVIDAHIAKLNGENAIEAAIEMQSPEPVFAGLKAGTLVVEGSKIVPFPAQASEIDRLMKVVKARQADVRWSEKHTDTDSAEKLAKRRARLAEAQANLDAALMSIPETE